MSLYLNMKQFTRSLPLLAGMLIAAILLNGCGGGGDSGSSGSATAMGSVNVQLTDAPSCGYDHVYVTVDHVAISSDGNSWTTIPVSSSVTQPIDLLNLTNGVMLTLGTAPLPAGTYEQVRLVLKANSGPNPPFANSLVLTGSPGEIPLKTPSAQQSGYKILGPITVQPGPPTDLVLDFNACKSIVIAGASGLYLLKPVVRATAQVMSGTISGFALAGSQVSAYAQPAGTFITGTIVPTPSAGPSGQFNLGPILQTSATPGSSVDVVIVPPATSDQANIVIHGVPVTASTTTWISPSDGTSYFNGTPTTASGINTASGTVTVAGSPGEANLVASQTVTSTAPARTYEIAATTSASGTGIYSLSLAASGPWLGTYSGIITTTPIPLTQDTAITDAGIYSIVASDSLSISAPQSADVSAGPVTNLNFVLTQ